MAKENLIGVVDKIKCLSMYPNILLRFTLVIGSDKVNCLVTDKAICHQLLFLENGKKEVALFGQYNQKQQLIVQKLALRHSVSMESSLLKECGA
ncbi:hypothetical protein [Vagococcus hydrophili]|uniref:Uncharacterized protein n=1 Tax=Vagococcus hydrophili TaxID=2714947 RepID=A0A6G8AW00_9ENTE|nr:hypothetical protein [Vagococcus hydrophili]QIL49234.1 hypothetical protein G7082_12395 [Vagococcus hydrophili]